MSNYKKSKDDPRLIYKIHADNTFVSVIGPDNKYDNVVLEFIEFDKKSNKKLNEIDIYYTIPDFLTLCQMIKDRTLIGMLWKDKVRCQQNNITYSDGRLVSKRGGGMVDNVVKYRETYFCSAASDKMSGVFVAEIMDGVKNNKGLINPKLTNGSVTNKKVIRVPFVNEDLYNMAMIGQFRIQAYLTAKQLRGDFERRVEEQSYTEPQPDTAPTAPVQDVQPQVTQPQTYVAVQIQDPQYSQGYQQTENAVSEDTGFNPDEAFYQRYAAEYGM